MPHRLVPFVSLVAVAIIATPSAAQNKCDAGKLKCIRQKVGCLIKVHEKSQKKGSPPDARKLQKCMEKFDGGDDPSRGCFAKVEAKADKQGVTCSTVGNVTPIEAQVDQDVQDYLDALSVAVPTTTTSSTTTSTLVTACGGPPDAGVCLGDCPLGQTCGEFVTGVCSCEFCSGCDLCNEMCAGECEGHPTCGWFDVAAFNACTADFSFPPAFDGCAVQSDCGTACSMDPSGNVCMVCGYCSGFQEFPPECS